VVDIESDSLGPAENRGNCRRYKRASRLDRARRRRSRYSAGPFHGEVHVIDLLWDLHQERRIGDAQQSASQAARKATDFQDRVRGLEDRIDRLLLTNMALWSLLRETMGVTDEDLNARIREIDLRDGVPDGKVTRSPRMCPQCQRTFSPRHRRCLYCGQEVAAATPFDRQ
jgi:ribosomal protein S27AE